MPAPNARTQEKILALHDLSGGIKSDHNETTIPDNASPVSYNLVFREGYLVPRPGTEEVTFTGIDLDADWANGFIVYYNRHLVYYSGFATAVIEVLLLAASGTYELWYKDASGTWADSGVTGLLARAGSVVFQNKIYVTSGYRLFIYDVVTDTWTSIANGVGIPANASHLITSTPSRLFWVSQSDSASFRINWSDFMLPTVWNGPSEALGSSGYQEFLDSKNNRGTALVSEGTTVYVFTTYEMYVGVPDQGSTYKFTKVYQDIGCTGQYAIVALGSGTYCWADPNDIYIGRLGEPPQRLGASLRRTAQDLVTGGGSFWPNGLGRVLGLDVHMCYDKLNKFIHIFTDAPPLSGNGIHTTSTLILSLYLDTMTWFIGGIEFPVNAINTSNLSTQVMKPDQFFLCSSLIGGGSGPKVIELTWDRNLDYDDSAYSCLYRSKLYHFLGLSGGKFQQGDIQKVRAIGKGSGEVDIHLLQGNNWDRLEPTDFGTQVFDDTGGSNPDFYLSGKTRNQSEYFQLELSANSDDWPKVAGTQVSFIDRGDTRQGS